MLYLEALSAHHWQCFSKGQCTGEQSDWPSYPWQWCQGGIKRTWQNNLGNTKRLPQEDWQRAYHRGQRKSSAGANLHTQYFHKREWNNRIQVWLIREDDLEQVWRKDGQSWLQYRTENRGVKTLYVQCAVGYVVSKEVNSLHNSEMEFRK